jgi:hypothetical protein
MDEQSGRELRKLFTLHSSYEKTAERITGTRIDPGCRISRVYNNGSQMSY